MPSTITTIIAKLNSTTIIINTNLGQLTAITILDILIIIITKGNIQATIIKELISNELEV